MLAGTSVGRPYDSRRNAGVCSFFVVLRTRELFGCRHAEFRALGDAVGPTLHHAFVAAVEANAFFAISVVITEQRALPAAERVPGHGHRNRHVDADHADLDAAGKRAGDAAVAGETGHAVAEFMG